ncbi:putative pectinesterase/pectinesterase inhibitor 58 [Choanephora cucurbitarum]|uniref:Pectinesterase n=1 Tax=Choanephora cucurbitarum TaxID=101091 RepID=A0A1C7N6R7_9FUNG|nr:putative pectinesterase/pectinesterase inhibitor 58 [Choanephora cucurbitarum]
MSEAASVKVCASCDYQTISDALHALPNDNQSYTVSIAAGVYNERIWVNRSNVNLEAAGSGKVYIQYSIAHNTQDPSSHAWEKAVVTVNGNNVSFRNLVLSNTFKQTRNIATVALNVQGQKVSFYKTKIYGFQDTLLISAAGTAYFKDCYVEGSVDFIFGYGVGYFQGCVIGSNAVGYVTAQNRASESATGGFYFNQCHMKATIPSGPIASNADNTLSFTSNTQFANSTYLGRPWSQYARVVYMNSYFENHIKPAGWSIWKATDPRINHVLFGEYKNNGPIGSFGSLRAPFASLLNSTDIAHYKPFPAIDCALKEKGCIEKAFGLHK